MAFDLTSISRYLENEISQNLTKFCIDIISDKI